MPTFTTSFNLGKVIVGELGEIKSAICFIGNVLYETTAIEKQVGKFKTDNLISDKLLKIVKLPKKYKSKTEGVLEIAESKTITVSSIYLA